jgi:Fe-S cluster biogenesis protein NfuA
VRPQLGSHGGDVHLVSVDEQTGVVRLRLDGTCDGCPASSATLELAVADAIRAEAPEVAEIAVDDAQERRRPALQRVRASSDRPGGPRDRRRPAPLRRPRDAPRRRSAAICASRRSRGEHPHLVDCRSRRLLCACAPCALLFDHAARSRGRFKRVPTERRRLRDLRLGADFWERLQIPVRLAFFFENSDVQQGRRVLSRARPAPPSRCCRSTRGARSVAANPALGTLEADVEACCCATARRAARVLPGADRRLLCAHRLVRRTGRASRAAPRPGARSTASSPISRERARRGGGAP